MPTLHKTLSEVLAEVDAEVVGEVLPEVVGEVLPKVVGEVLAEVVGEVSPLHPLLLFWKYGTVSHLHSTFCVPFAYLNNHFHLPTIVWV